MTRQETRQQDRQLRPSPKAPGRGSPTPCTWVDRPRKQRRGHRPAHSQGNHTRTLSKVPAVTAPQRVPARGLLTVTEHHGQQRASKATTRGKGLGSTPPSRPVAPLTRSLLIIQAVRNFPRDTGPRESKLARQVGEPYARWLTTRSEHETRASKRCKTSCQRECARHSSTHAS